MHPGEGANGSMKSFPHTVVNTHGQTVVIPAFVFFVLRSFPFVQEEIDAALAICASWLSWFCNPMGFYGYRI